MKPIMRQNKGMTIYFQVDRLNHGIYTRSKKSYGSNLPKNF